jgi:hypothetical protein
MVTTGAARSLASSAALAPVDVPPCPAMGRIRATGLPWLVHGDSAAIPNLLQNLAGSPTGVSGRYGVFDGGHGRSGIAC